jgi:5-methyltetrahydropteroyltriglutamate--homocysteine methyltransferase
MRRSNGRTLTTHTGSLPRSDTLVNLLAAQNRGEPVDAETFAAEVESSTRQVIKNQAQSGIDVGNNGEQSRMSFSTYVTLRLSGFGGSWQRRGHRDQNEFPGAVRTRAVSIMNAPKCIAQSITNDWMRLRRNAMIFSSTWAATVLSRSFS